jgi:Excalibur calcium-binding domain
MLRTAFAVTAVIVGAGIATAPATLADPPYRNCTEAHADGRYNIPSDDPAYRPQLDRDGDGLACEPYKGR